MVICTYYYYLSNVHLHTIHYIQTYIRTCALEIIFYQYRSLFVRSIAIYIGIKGMIMV